jgi:hypothetical protein
MPPDSPVCDTIPFGRGIVAVEGYLVVILPQPWGQMRGKGTVQDDRTDVT